MNFDNVRLMYCRCGQGLMTYTYKFTQIGTQNYNDPITKKEIVKSISDCEPPYIDARQHPCKRITFEEFKQIIGS